MEPNVNNLLDFDKRHIWHPYSSATQPSPIFEVARCDGVFIELQDGRRLIDGMSSWWSALHGYNHPKLNEALEAQASKMSHVMFGGFTHKAAVELCQRLVKLTPQRLQRVFLADSGSVAVEVALKMAIQYFSSRGRAEKFKMMTFKRGYHGDTFGAMSVSDPKNGMHHLFSSTLAQHIFIDEPPLGFDIPLDANLADRYRAAFANHAHECAAFILEPIVQGAGGMRFYHPDYLTLIRSLCDEFNLLLIADEIATGFGRTGQLFAVNHANITPDIMCLGKAITGGYMTLAATLCTEELALGLSEGEAGVFMHGPTFMGNPLACAVAVASIDLLMNNQWQMQVASIERQLYQQLSVLERFSPVQDVRVLGAIAVIEMKEPVDLNIIQPCLVERGIWLRPFGKLIYMMPPFSINSDELSHLCSETVATIISLFSE